MAEQPDKVGLQVPEVILLHLLAVQHILHKVEVDQEDHYLTMYHHHQLIMEELEQAAAAVEGEIITLDKTALEDQLINRVYQILDQI